MPFREGQLPAGLMGASSGVAAGDRRPVAASETSMANQITSRTSYYWINERWRGARTTRNWPSQSAYQRMILGIVVLTMILIAAVHALRTPRA
jgi:hypothetical protein